MKRYSIIFKRTKDKVEQIYITCEPGTLGETLEYVEIFEENILSIIEVN